MTGPRAKSIKPNAQMGSLYPFVRSTADRSTFELSFLHERFTDIDAWKARRGR